MLLVPIGSEVLGLKINFFRICTISVQTWRRSRSGWTRLWATWSSCRYPCSLQSHEGKRIVTHFITGYCSFFCAMHPMFYWKISISRMSLSQKRPDYSVPNSTYLFLYHGLIQVICSQIWTWTCIHLFPLHCSSTIVLAPNTAWLLSIALQLPLQGKSPVQENAEPQKHHCLQHFIVRMAPEIVLDCAMQHPDMICDKQWPWIFVTGS